jgi:hypothetical protein
MPTPEKLPVAPSLTEEKRCPERYVDSTELYDAAYEGDVERVEG